VPSNFTKIASWGSTGTGDTNLNGPSAIATDGQFLYIADILNHRLLKWSMTTGALIASKSDFYCYAINVVGARLYVNDTYNNYVKILRKSDFYTQKTSAAFSNPIDVLYFRDYVWVVDDSDDAIYRCDPNTLEVLATIQLSGVTEIYKAITGMGDYLYLLTQAGGEGGGHVYRFNVRTLEVDKTYAVTQVLDPYYMRSHDGYIFVIGTEDAYVMLDGSLQLILTADYADDATWTSAYDLCTFTDHYFLVADYSADQILLLYGYDRQADVASGDAVTIDGDWDFGDDVIIGGSEDNLSTVGFVRNKDVKNTKFKWSKL
jgi:DNA-binding beta-propeller fold protein YncE